MHIYIVVLMLFYLTHHIHIYSRHSAAYSCSSAVQCHNHTLLEGRICPPLLKIPPILPRTAHLSHICFFECMKTNEHTSSTTHASVGHPARAEIARTVANPLEAHCIHVCTKFPQSLHETALCSSLTETLSLCTLLLQANAPPWQTSPCSRWVVARYFPASVGFTLPLAVPPSRTATALGGPDNRTWVAWKLRSITKTVQSLSHL